MSTSTFEAIDTPLAGLKVIQCKQIKDERGFLCRLFCNEEFHEIGFENSIAQINHTHTQKLGTVRGLHFQYPPAAEAKIVSCLKGEIYDVAVDIRYGSATFLHWHAELLSSDNQKSLLIPEGFAHGYQALADGCELLYLHSAKFCPDAVGALNVLDPQLAIRWPLKISELSDRDRQHPFIGSDFEGVII